MRKALRVLGTGHHRDQDIPLFDGVHPSESGKIHQETKDPISLIL